jgi:ATP synthase I chain
VNLNLDFPRLSSRLSRFIVAIAIAGSALAGLLGGWTWAAGFFLGAAASYLNFRNLIRVVAVLGKPESSGRIGAFGWMLFRLILLFAVAFVMIKLTRINIFAAFAGLFAPVAAVILEAILELTYAR